MRILVVDDDPGLRQSLGLLLSEAGHEVTAEGEARRALTRATEVDPDVILSDVRMPGMDGLEFLRAYRTAGGRAILLMMSAHGSEDSAIAAMREGAYDYLHKPFRPDEVLLTLRKVEEREGLRREVATLRATLGVGQVQDDVVAESAAMRHLLELASRVAAHDTTVLITGESGTGKEVLARAIHRMSARCDGPFVAINCAAIPEQLLESELFGHARGAFTGATHERAGLFEEATDGTLLLDEIGDLPAGLQAKLLRVLEEREVRRVGESKSRPVNARLVAATARRLEDARAAGEFRDDLYYRLNVVELEVPPLRDRPEDVPALLAHFAQRTAKRLGHPISFSPQALSYLSSYKWPGNVRELRNAVERAAVLSASGRLEREAFQLGATVAPAPNGNGNGHGQLNGHAADHRPSSGDLLLKGRVEALERDLVQQALQASGGSRREAADLLGVSLRTLFYKLRRYRLE